MRHLVDYILENVYDDKVNMPCDDFLNKIEDMLIKKGIEKERVPIKDIADSAAPGYSIQDISMSDNRDLTLKKELKVHWHNIDQNPCYICISKYEQLPTQVCIQYGTWIYSKKDISFKNIDPSKQVIPRYVQSGIGPIYDCSEEAIEVLQKIVNQIEL